MCLEENYGLDEFDFSETYAKMEKQKKEEFVKKFGQDKVYDSDKFDFSKVYNKLSPEKKAEYHRFAQD